MATPTMAAMSAFTRRLGAASARRPWTTIAAWAVATAVIIALAGMAGGAFAEDFVAPGSQSERARQLLEERFPEAANGAALAVFAAPDGQRLEQHRAAVDAAVTRIATAEGVSTVANPFAAGTVSPDGRVAYAEIAFAAPATRLGPEPFKAVGSALEPARQAGLTAELGGDAAFINSETQTSGAEAVGLLAALVILLVAFGTVVAALVPIVLALIVVAAGLAGILLLANAMDVSTAAPTIAAMIGLGVGIDYALFITARYRENRAGGADNSTALVDAMGRAGSAVVFAGGTVIIAMAALLLTGMGFLVSVGLSTALVVFGAGTAALTLLPAFLTLLGDRLDRGRLPSRRRRRAQGTGWWRLAHHIARRPWPYLVVSVALLLTLAAPALAMRTAFPDAGDESTSTTERRAYDLLADGFGPGVNGPLLLVVDLRGTGAGDIRELARRVAADPGIASVGEPVTSPANDTVILRLTATTAPADAATSRTLERVRGMLPDNAYVAGLTAMTADLTHHLSTTLPIFVGAILAASFLLLMLVFRSILVPLKAVLMNLLSIGGAYGVVVVVFQWGWFTEDTVTIASPLPMIFFAVLFGLSMDYEVFLLSRVREEYNASGDTTESIARGLAGTGRVITSAALIMTAVFLSFAASPSPFTKMIGIGLATAVLLDATIVRLFLLPAAMTLLGPANWWLPRWLRRRIPRAAARGGRGGKGGRVGGEVGVGVG
ncbi:membrane protein [Phytohabitans aurantiacus]|uniref:Membrane protein n=2 Tax=Phytohabitans aurantiacus TaxID=3016789 RepID=A0ABQ5QZI2_9ACTN|nr:membrane protein [Phytohabitans aurantiacus]